MTTAQNTVNAAVSIRNLSKHFATEGREVEALRDVSLEIREGEFLAIVGPSGCGKSTLLMIVAGLLAASRGEVRIDDSPVDGPYTNVGIVFQNHVLLEWRTALQNVLFQADMRRLPRRQYEQRARELMQMVSLKGFEDHYPHELSGGMKQRTSICRALLHDPPYLLMDEPFGALDALTRDQLCIDLEKIWLGSHKTVVFITHSVPEAVQLADRVVVMTPRPGRIYRELTIDLPRPRYERGAHDAALGEAVDEIKRAFMEQGVLRA